MQLAGRGLTVLQLKTISCVVWSCNWYRSIALLLKNIFDTHLDVIRPLKNFLERRKVQNVGKNRDFHWLSMDFYLLNPPYEWVPSCKNHWVFTFLIIKTVSRVVWWCRLLLRVPMIPGKCLEAHSTIALCLEKFLRHQKSVEVVQKSSKTVTFCYVFVTILPSKWFERG